MALATALAHCELVMSFTRKAITAGPRIRDLSEFILSGPCQKGPNGQAAGGVCGALTILRLQCR